MQRHRIVRPEERLATKGICSSIRSSVTRGDERWAESLGRLLARSWQLPSGNRLGKAQELTGRDLAEIVELLKCKLAWFGFRSVKVGPFIRVKDNTVSIDLLDRGEVLCRVELDRRSGAIKPLSSDVLRPLMRSLRAKSIGVDG